MLDWFFVFGLALFSGMVLRLVATGSLEDTSGSGLDAPLVTYIGLAIYAICLLLIFTRPLRWVGGGLVLASLLCGFAILSALWSLYPDVAIRRSLALTGAIGFAYLFCTTYPPPERMRLLRNFAYLFVVVNLIAVALPGYGIHDLSDAAYAEHAGRWRGLFFHKNELAQASSIVLLILLMSGSGVYRPPRLLHYAMLGGCIAIIVYSASAQIYLAAPAGVIGYYFHLGIRHSQLRLLAFLGLIVTGAVFVTAGPMDWLMEALPSIVGRDSTLSNRTTIWEIARENGAPYWVGGRGYGVTWDSGVGAAVKSAIRSNPGHPHNGFIQVWLDLGVIGLALIGALLVYAVVGTINKFRPRGERRYGAFLLGFLVVDIVISFAGSELMRYNGLFWTLLLIAAFSVRDPTPPLALEYVPDADDDREPG